ncbi:MAG TPA: hypothetical protein VNT60_01420 [Deinococcales bacterium]|nr:hypothetical protein [Deinococcales bacterium]
MIARELRDFSARFLETNRSFSEGAGVAFRKEIEALAAHADNYARLTMGLARAIALADDGHTTLDFERTDGKRFLPRAPLRLALFPEGLHVVAAEDRELLGRRVTAIAGVPMDDVIQSLLPYSGGNTAHRRLQALAFLESPAALASAGIGSSEAAYVLTLDGIGERLVRASAGKTSGHRLAPADLPHVLDGTPLPAYLRDLSLPARHEWLPGRILYVRINSNSDAPGMKLDDFLQGVLQEAARGDVMEAVVDLRLNGGGNYLNTWRFARDLPACAAGRIAVLVGPWTFSAGIVTAALVKSFARGRAVLFGEEMGDREQFWAESVPVDIGSSGLRAWATTARHDWQNGPQDPRSTFWLNMIYGAAAGSLRPEHEVPTTFEAYRSGRDPVLERALQYLAEAPGTSPCREERSRPDVTSASNTGDPLDAALWVAGALKGIGERYDNRAAGEVSEIFESRAREMTSTSAVAAAMAEGYAFALGEPYQKVLGEFARRAVDLHPLLLRIEPPHPPDVQEPKAPTDGEAG